MRTFVEPAGAAPLASFDHAAALRQHEAYAALLAELEVEVELLEADESLPDCCFVEDQAIVLPELCVLARSGVASRRRELASVAGSLARDLPIARLREPALLEGGDVLRVDRTLFVGLSTRTNRAGIAALAELAQPRGYAVRAVEVRAALHLKSAAGSLGDGRLLINPACCDAEAFGDLARVEVPADEPTAANVLRIGDVLLVSSSHPRTAELLAGLGHELRRLEIGEFERIEGGVSCLSILWEVLG